MNAQKLKFEVILFGLVQTLRVAARTSARFHAEVAKKNCTVQIRLKDKSQGRYLVFRDGRVRSRRGIHPTPDAALVFKDLDIALTLLTQPENNAESVHAAKNFLVHVEGDDECASWFMQTVNAMGSLGLAFGTQMRDGSRRYTTMTNGGPLFVFVKDGKILRVTPLAYSKEDAGDWTLDVRGKRFAPLRKATVAPHALALKSVVYSKDRLLYPMKRVDFDPKGDRNPGNRGISGYERISWDEALDIVSSEILRMKSQHGPGAIAAYNSSHHQWGNLNYYLSAFMRFGNTIGVTRVHHNPDSWEGWYWGAMHHHGASMRLGNASGYGTLEDCLQECEMIIYWSSDPESQYGAYGGQESTQRRLWGKDLGIKSVHINPHYCPTARFVGGKWLPIRPGTDNALAIAIMYVWITEGLYDKEYIASHTTGFDEWKSYVLGHGDGVAKTPEWQQAETGIAAKDVRALAREWARKKTYLAPGVSGTGFGGACRGPTGLQWARSMILLMAMQGWGKPGVNFGNLSFGAPVNLEFYFPGYAEGGISGELQFTASAANNYVRMPHVISINPVHQMIPRLRLPEAILDGHCEGYPTDPSSPEAQFSRYEYPAPGYSRVHMLYRYGGSSFGTIARSGRFIDMYRSPELECVVNQSVWFEGEAKFADILLPACTQAERLDIGEWSNSAGFGHHFQSQLNRRVVAIQHKCIEPLGESKSDYQIFWDITKRLGLGAYYSEGMTELDWCKRIFKSSELPKYISWKKFLKKGYFVVPAEKPDLRVAPDMRWFFEGKQKNVPEPYPFPGANSKKHGMALPTQSGKIEFVPETLKRFEADSPDRPALNRYIPSWEGRSSEGAAAYPLQLVTPHQRFSFHTMMDGKGSSINDLREHRILINGHYYWILRMNPRDAATRGIDMHDLVKVYNGRGTVICAAELTETIMPGVLHAYESSAVYDPVGESGKSPDRGGCVNMLTSDRKQIAKSDSMASSNCLVEVGLWEGNR
jgi:molybdopterin guanine dinucleotide-containing S/N-oxide reductase-like protein